MSQRRSNEPKSDISFEFVRSIISYDSHTGVFTWKRRDGVPASWNTKFAGKIAGTPDARGYLKITINNNCYKAHRIAWLLMTGEWPDYDIDHIDMNKRNNRWENLRSATRAQNLGNRVARASSGYKGAYKQSNADSWQARICVGRRGIYLGSFATPQEAHDAYCRAAITYFGKYARTE